jgi:CelD/BcsL family acetyltransferase involved in cellulose biosynthesis
MRQQLRAREHFRRGNAILTLIVARHLNGGPSDRGLAGQAAGGLCVDHLIRFGGCVCIRRPVQRRATPENLNPWEIHGNAMLKSSETLDSYQFVTDLDALRRLQRDWDELFARSTGHYLGQTFTWALISWETVCGPRGRRLYCLVARRDGKVGLIWPFVMYRRRLYSVAHPLGSETSEYSTVLIEECVDAEQRIKNALKVLRATCECDRLELPNVRADSVLGSILSQSRGLALYTVDAPWVSWAGIDSWDTYFRALSGTHRSGLRRKLRRLREVGELRCEVVTDPVHCEAILDWMLGQKRAWLEKSGLHNDWILTREYRAFLSASTAVFAPSGHRIIFTLKLDGRIIAAELSSVDESRVEWFMGAHDPEYGKYSPGQLLKEECLRWAFDRRLDYDFRIGNEPEKLIWSNRVDKATTYVFANSAWGATYVLGRKARIEVVRCIPPERRASIKILLRRLIGPRPTAG